MKQLKKIYSIVLYFFIVAKSFLHELSDILKAFMLFSIRLYRRYISPIKPGGKHCKYIPTCSQYAILAIEKYGPFKGGLLAINRILRCNPFSKGGYDPVP